MTTKQLNYLGARFNDTSALDVTTVAAQMLKAFAKETPILSRMNTDVSNAVEGQGESVDVQLPVDLGEANDLARGESSSATAINAQTARVTLDNHIYKEFEMSEREFATIQQGGTISDSIRAAIRSVTNRINRDALGLHTSVYSVAGGGGYKFDLSTLVSSRTKLTQLGVEKADRFLALGAVSTGDLLNANIAKYDASNPAAVEGMLGRHVGFDTFEDEAIDLVIGGANPNFPDAMTVSSSVYLGDYTIPVSGIGSGQVIEDGDRFKLAGSPRMFTAVGNYDDSASSITVVEALPALVGGEAITATTEADTYEANVAYHKSAFTAAFRSLSAPAGNTGGATVQVINVPGTNIPIKFSTWYDASSGTSKWKVEALYGMKATRPGAAALVLPTA